MSHSLFAVDGSRAVGLSERKREARAGRGQGLKPEARQQLRRARVPGVGNGEHAGPIVERFERLGLCHLKIHLFLRKGRANWQFAQSYWNAASKESLHLFFKHHNSLLRGVFSMRASFRSHKASAALCPAVWRRYKAVRDDASVRRN